MIERIEVMTFLYRSGRADLPPRKVTLR